MSAEGPKVVLALVCLAVAVPVLLPAGTSLMWIAVWLGAAITSVALFSALVVFWRTGALRLRYIVLLGVAVAIAAAAGSLLRGG